jgi:DNA-binding GntR family transcriptional regulator
MTTEDRVIARMRRMIVEGALAPGEKLTVAALATRLATGVTPVRAALKTLEAEGLVEAHPNRGAWVRRLAPDDIRNIYRLRGAVIRLLIPDVIRYISDADLEELDLLEARFEAAVAQDASAAMAANEDFHAHLFSIARNRDAAAVMSRSWALVEALRLRLGFGPGRLARSVESHRALLVAIRRRDAAAATALAVASSDQAMEDLLHRAGGDKAGSRPALARRHAP